MVTTGGGSGWQHLREHYESCFERSGASPAGVDWPRSEDLEVRFAVQLQVLDRCFANLPVDLLDLGCGPGLLVDFLAAAGLSDRVRYVGIDLSEPMIACARERWPGVTFDVRDILARPMAPQSVDVVLMNGVLTERRSIPFATMEAMARDLIASAFALCRVGIAFNVMSVHVDWERDDLFHWSFDGLMSFLAAEVSRHVEFHAHYGLYEYTVFVWREPFRPKLMQRSEWWLR